MGSAVGKIANVLAPVQQMPSIAKQRLFALLLLHYLDVITLVYVYPKAQLPTSSYLPLREEFHIEINCRTKSQDSLMNQSSVQELAFRKIAGFKPWQAPNLNWNVNSLAVHFRSTAKSE